jgi:soluble lytic murein transglycosylase-like protein
LNHKAAKNTKTHKGNLHLKSLCTSVFFVSLWLINSVQCRGEQIANLRNGFSIRHVRTELHDRNTRLYLDSSSFVDVPTADIVSFEDAPAPAPVPVPPAAQISPVAQPVSLDSIITSAGEKHHLDPAFIRSVIKAESAFKVRAVSAKGARGLMQLMPATAKQLGVADSFDANQNVVAGTAYLRSLLEQYHDDVPKALAAYNAGPLRVTHYKGVPPFRETHAYVARVIRDYNRAKQAEMRSASNPPPVGAQ